MRTLMGDGAVFAADTRGNSAENNKNRGLSPASSTATMKSAEPAQRSVSGGLRGPSPARPGRARQNSGRRKSIASTATSLIIDPSLPTLPPALASRDAYEERSWGDTWSRGGAARMASQLSQLETTTPDFASQEQAETQHATFEHGLSLFNDVSAKKGIEFLINVQILKRDPREVAALLLRTRELRKSRIGEYLGGADSFRIEVLDAYVRSLVFTGLGFEMALRSFLSAFCLPGEAQQIDRVLEKFAYRYCEQNPTLFDKPDTAYLLGFAIIMLTRPWPTPTSNRRPS